MGLINQSLGLSIGSLLSGPFLREGGFLRTVIIHAGSSPHYYDETPYRSTMAFPSTQPHISTLQRLHISHTLTDKPPRTASGYSIYRASMMSPQETTQPSSRQKPP